MNPAGDETIDHPGRSDPHERETVAPSGSAAELVAILDGYLADLQAGRAPDREALLAAHPELAAQLEACLAGIEFVHRAAGPSAEAPAVLGEFRIVRELGRGGMGVVYEAEQTSLHRQVALKVLRLGVGIEEEAMTRFRREAETVARLHHTNIVPIFAVGSERGVHYYAMQLIEGRSLADVLDEAGRSGLAIAVEDLLGWCLQAAEALAHAHHRGVIHRDIKPSNLLIDGDGVVWLTDFGLAKRADEVALTASGALMGTPRYMSPEQAESLQRTIDHRTDVYSLGATLYELATGRPAFDSATPHGVVIQILNEEPVRPRRIRPDLPRDLETIILTCLAKDPAQRYQTARSLADDLRAVLDGRPIQARRVSPAERVLRYLRKRKKALQAGAVVAAATVLLMLGAWASWRFFSEWRRGRIILTTDGPPLTARVLPVASDEAVTGPFDVGTRTTVDLPAGEYRLRLEASGLMSRTTRFVVQRAETRTHRVSLDENRLLGDEPIPYAPFTEALVLRGKKADFVEWTGQALIRRDGSSGRPIWDASKPQKPGDAKRDPVAWLRRLSYHGGGRWPGTLVQPAPDLDGDGTADLVWAIEGTPAFLAISGGNGSMLWTCSARPDGPGGPDPAGPAEPKPGDPLPPLSHLRGEPVATDVDGDGTADIIASFGIFEDREDLDRIRRSFDPTGSGRGLALPLSYSPASRAVVVAVSGRSGRWLWDHSIAGKTGTVPSWPERDAIGPCLVSTPRGPALMVVEGSRCVPLDPATGRPGGPSIDLGFEPRRVHHVDLDRDGAPDVLAVGYAGGIAAISGATGRKLWGDELYGVPSSGARPVVADLDGDGRPEVAIREVEKTWKYSGVRLMDGATGSKRWSRPLSPSIGDSHDVFAAPDLDGDGTRDLVAVSSPNPAYVDAISGRDGRPLWWWRAPLTNSHRTILSVRWWGRGPDGWPLLVVGRDRDPEPSPLAPQMFDHDPGEVHLLAASTGREVHRLGGLSWPRLADLDGDQVDDLWGSAEGKLRAYRGELPETWRALGRFQPAGDLDGDGVVDVVSDDREPPQNTADSVVSTHVAVARSGRDGRVLWQTSLEPWAIGAGDEQRGFDYVLSAYPLPGGDLDGDGVADILIGQRLAGLADREGWPEATLPLRALSGRTGRRLWSAGPLPLGFTAHGYSWVEATDIRRVHAPDPPDVVALHISPFPDPARTTTQAYEQTRLARLSGGDGRVLWDTRLVERGAPRMPRPAEGEPGVFGDLDGDGSLDIVVPLENRIRAGPIPYELHAIALRDGQALWTHAVGTGFRKGNLAVGDLDGDGRAEVVVKRAAPDGVEAAVAVEVLDGRDGTTRWTWYGGSRLKWEDFGKDAIGIVDLGEGHRRAVCLKVNRSFRLASGVPLDQLFDQIRREAPDGMLVGHGTADQAGVEQRVVLLDENGHERSARSLPAPFALLASDDLDGDGRADVLFVTGGGLRAMRGDLRDLWAWDGPQLTSLRRIVPAQAGRPATLVLETPGPSRRIIGLDGAMGKIRWDGGSSRELLDPGNGDRSPLLLALPGDERTTSCRVALPTSPEGVIQPPRGEPATASLARDDPRWERLLPWSSAIPSNPSPGTYLSMAGLALFNIVLPLGILRLAARKRPRGRRLLIALPIALAAPAMAVAYRLGFAWPPLDDPATWAAVAPLALGSLKGLPVLAYAVLVARSLVGWRGERLAWLVAWTVMAALVVGAGFLSSDVGSGDARDHYAWSGWYELALPGAYVVGGLALIAWALRGGVRWLSRPGRAAAEPAV